jgi:hypothetical protein
MFLTTGNMQGQLDAIWDHLLPAFQSKPLPADAADQAKLKDAVAHLVDPPKKRKLIMACRIYGRSQCRNSNPL